MKRRTTSPLDAALSATLLVYSALDGLWVGRPVLKSWGGRYGVWFGLGYQDKWEKPITKSWLRTTLPPYMLGLGVCCSLGHNSIRIGVYKVLGFLDPLDYDDLDVGEELRVLEAIGWRAGVDNGEEIGTWQTQQPAPEVSPLPPSRPEFVPSSSDRPTSTSGPRPSP